VREQFAQGSVGIGNFSVIEILIARVVWRRRIVGRVRVVQMNPNEERGWPAFAEPGDRVLHHVSRATLDGVVAALIRTMFGSEAGVEEIEPSVEPRRHAGFWIEDERTDEGPGVVSTLLQDFRYEG